MGRVGRKAGRSLQLLVRGGKRRLDAFSPGPVFFRIDGELRDRRGKTFSQEVTGDQTDQEQRRAGAQNLPAQTTLARERILQRVKADLVNRRESGLGIEPLEEEE